jgi:HD superfamily phosphodiesterase
MPVPGRVEAASILLSLEPSAWLLRHSCAVAEVAAWLALRAQRHGLSVDRRAVEAAALLHDGDKAFPREDPVRRLPHGEGSAAWLEGLGLGELGPLVARHPVTRLADSAAEEWLRSAPLEALIVAYADKRAGQRLESMDDRFANWGRRYPLGLKHGWDEATVESVRERARRLERDVCDRLGIGPGDVRRLRWTDRAIRSAAGAR